jgi:hypothetical protein
LRIIARPLGAPLWLLFCYDNTGNLYKCSLGTYPKVGVDQARNRAHKLRLKVKAITPAQKPKAKHRGITVEQLILLYEGSCPTSTHWGRQKASLLYALEPFLYHKWDNINLKQLQSYIDAYPSRGRAISLLRTIVKWGENNGIIKMRTQRIMRPPPPQSRARIAARTDSSSEGG